MSVCPNDTKTEEEVQEEEIPSSISERFQPHLFEWKPIYKR